MVLVGIVETDYDLAASIRGCERCPLNGLRTGLAVPADVGRGAVRRGIAVLGEAPGAQEDAVGLPFVGPAGRILAGILHDVGLSREDITILNRVRCRPPRNDLKSHPEAVLACDDWTKAELSAYDPAVVVLVGATAIGSIFGASAKVGQVRGQVRVTGEEFEYGSRTWIATYHPASLLPHRRPQNRALVVADFMLAKELATSGSLT